MGKNLMKMIGKRAQLHNNKKYFTKFVKALTENNYKIPPWTE